MCSVSTEDQIKHRALVEELKHRKANGEGDLIICKDAIIKNKLASWSDPPNFSNVPLMSVLPSTSVNCLNVYGLASPNFVLV